MTAAAAPPRTARDLARAEITERIKAAARAQLAHEGAAALSLRAAAREIGIVSSGVYRYFASRDALLTALIVDAYDSLGEAAETAEAQARAAGADPGARWLAACRGVRDWALAHPHEFALVYGSPVPGYSAPEETVAPATRLSGVLAVVLRDAAAAEALDVPLRPLPGPSLVSDAVVELAGGRPAPPYDDLLDRSLVLLIALVGALTMELFGHLHGVVTDHDAYFDTAMRVAAAGVGLQLHVDAAPGAA
jgi:AcrR family transcriptional regulator